jgi:hypothetical protein
MKYARVMLTTLIVLTSIEAVALAQQVPRAGGYMERRANDPEVVSATRFAIREASRRERTPVTLVLIKQAESQVVAGRNFRLQLSVRSRGEIRDAYAEVQRNLRQQYTLTRWETTGRAAAGTSSTREVKVYLIALNDQGRTGAKVGCDDSLVPVTRTINATDAPLKAALQELLSMPREYEGRLSNSWHGRNLKVRTVTLRAGVATIRITGELFVAGVCDAPRIEAQIKETTRQFPTVRTVKVFVNNRTLAQAIR